MTLPLERVPWLAGLLGAALVFLATSLRPIPPDPTEVAARGQIPLGKAIILGVPDQVIRRVLALGTEAVTGSRQAGELAEAERNLASVIDGRLPAGVRFELVRFAEDGSKVERILRVPRGNQESRPPPRPADPEEVGIFDRRDAATLSTSRYLVTWIPAPFDARTWYRIEAPKAPLVEIGSSVGWVGVLAVALVVGLVCFISARREIERRSILAALSAERPGPQELARLASFGDFGTRIGRLLEAAHDRAAMVEDLLSTLKVSCVQLSESVERLYQVSHEQSGGASSQAAAIQEVSTTAEEMAATARQISDNAARVTALAEETAQACVNGHTSVQDAIRGMEEVRRQVEAIAKRMTVLGANSSKIGGVTAIIDEISKQTNLLALNAAIEAAGAGEAGKRFGVVAVEVKRLADKTSNATKMIKELIQAIQEDTESTVRETEHGTESAMAGAQLVKAVGEALDLIGERVQQTTEAAREIRVSTGQQTHAASQMAGSLGQISDVSKQIEEGTHRAVGALVDLRESSRNVLDLVNRMGTIP